MRSAQQIRTRSNVVIAVTGQPPRLTHNIITDEALKLNRLRASGRAPAITWVCRFGTGSRTPSAGDTALESTILVPGTDPDRAPVERRFTTTVSEDGYGISLYTFLEQAAGNGNTIREIGMFAFDGETSTMYARASVTPEVPKNETNAVGVTWNLSWGRG